MRHISAFLIAFFYCNSLWASGFFMVSNFPKEKYSAGAQNWCMVQDVPGRVYFGNRDGLLIFDGSRWKKAYLANYTTVRSLFFDSQDGRLYAGGSEELGFFSNDVVSGTLNYTSLMNFFPENRPSFSEIWNIYKIDSKIWFQADNYMFCLNGDNIVIYPVDGRISTSALIGNSLYIAFEDGRIHKFVNGDFYPVKGLELIAGKRISTILPCGYAGEFIVGTWFDGIFKYDGEKIVPIPVDFNSFLSENQLFCGNQLNDTYIFGTVNNGAVLYNLANGKTDYINKETGLQNNTVLSAAFDIAGNIWLCLDNGLDYAVCNSAVSNLVGSNNTIGAGYCSLFADGEILYGTNQGLYSTAFPYASSPVPPIPRQHLHGQIWSIDKAGDDLLISADGGIYQCVGYDYSLLPGSSGTVAVHIVPRDENLALASSYDGFRMLKRIDGKWVDAGPMEGCNDLVGKFLFDTDGSVWLSHWRKGIFHLQPDYDRKTMEILHIYNSADGLPSNENNSVAIFDGHVVFSTRDGFFYPSASINGSIQSADELNRAFNSRRHGALQNLSDGSLAYIDRSGVYVASKRADGEIICRRLASYRLVDDLIPGYTNLNIISPSELIVSTQDGFCSVQRNENANESSRPNPFISAVFANQDSLIFSTPLDGNANGKIVLPFDLNSLKFEFALPDFDVENVEYSSYLENFESDWSQFSPEASREYTRLSEGDYTMHLRVRDSETGEIKEAALGFSIMPPWFRTTVAKILYFIGLILFFGFLGAVIKNRIEHARVLTERNKEKELEALRKQSEQEALVKDYEIANLKTEQLEQDIQHKSRELSATTMNLIHKNEMLSDIAAQLNALQQLASSEASSRTLISRNIAKLQSSVEKSLSGDNDWDTFHKNFDIVYNDYTKKLNTLYSNLTTADKRLCCYIRMGLSSKEIAPLINISYKSVEMARYRLRKKMNLPSETSLTEHLASL